MSTTYFECFNNKLKEFLNDLLVSFPEMNDLKLLKNGLHLATTIDVKMPQKFFNEHVACKYETHILGKNEEFFLNETYEAVAQQHGFDLDIVSKIKGIWGTIDGENKEIVWKYLQVLILLNRKCKN